MAISEADRGSREVAVCRSEELEEGGRVVVSIAGEELGVFRVDGRLYAWSNYCVHVGGPVCQGMLINRVEESLDEGKRSLGERFADSRHIVCPWHGYEYDVTTGEHATLSELKLRGYGVREQEGEILVAV